MSKNLSRKGLALAVAVALGTSVFGAVPAATAGVVSPTEVTLALNAGTSNNFTLASVAALKSNYASNLQIGSNKAKFLIEDSTSQVKAASNEAGNASPATLTFTAGKAVVAKSAANNTTAEVLRLALPNTVTASTNVTVTAWYDSDGDDVIDDAEKTSSPVVISFLANSAITLSTAILAPAVGAGSVTAQVTSSPELNGQQIDLASTGNISAYFTKGGAAGTDIDVNVSSTYDADAKKWNVLSESNTVAAAEVFSAQAQIEGFTDGTYSKVGTTVYYTVPAATVAADDAAVVTSADVTPTGTVRLTQKDASVKLSFTKADGSAVAAGIPVVLSWNNSSTSAAVVKINGTATTKSTGKKVVYTDATGSVVATVNNGTPVNGETVILDWATVQGVSGTNGSQTFTWATTAYSLSINAKRAAGTTIAGVTGQSTSFDVNVVDQFKQPIGSGYALRVVAGTRTVSNQVVAISAGKATISVADGGVTTGDTTVDATLVAADGTALASTDAAYGTSALTQQTIKYVAAGGTYAVTLGGDLEGTVNADEIKTVDTAIANAAAPVSGADATVTGTVANSVTGGARAGALVTVSGAGLAFNVGTNYGVGSLTFRASDTGTFSVDVYANKVTTGTVVTVTSEGASATKTFVFTSSLAAKSLTVTAPAYATAGTAVDVVATVADKWGNGVSASSLTLSSTGAGYLNATGSTTTVSSGTVRAKLIFGAAETGSAVITATTDASAILAADRTKTATVVIGKAPASASTVAISASTGKFYTSVTNAAGKKVVVKVAGKFVKSFTGTAAKKTLVTKTTKGSKKVTVFVGGKLVATKTITVK